MIECGDSIGRYHEQKIFYRIQIADLTSSKKLKVFEFSSDERRQRFRLGRGMTFRLSEVTTGLSTHEKSTLFAPHCVYRILDKHCQVGAGTDMAESYGGRLRRDQTTLLHPLA